MIRQVLKIASLFVLLMAGAVGVWYYQQQSSAQRQIADLKRETQQLQAIVERLSTERRIAQVLVTDQQRVDGVLETTLLFVEETRDGRTQSPRRITVRGDHVYIDALVIKFDQSFLKAGDELRGQSIALFDKIFGSAQTPDQAERIDHPGRIPEIYRGTSAHVSQFEQTLWSQFWALATDAEFARANGVRVAHGQSVYGPFEPGKLYILGIEPNGNISMTAEPVPAVYREWMKQAQ